MSSPLVGAWEIQSDLYEGFIVYTDSHYANTFVQKDRKQFQSSEPTQAEQAEAYQTTRAASGTYTISGSKIIHNEEFNRDPNGPRLEVEFSVDGNQLTWGRTRAASGWKFIRAS